ncbi:DUF4351 domain-containing protein [Microcoleus sp. FACHB-68]|uniref:DUF4351 domain-containing protein n=1 Tax=Microcoleus sp. FACHB-68 TaxID=2692826 RepID=UPI00168359F5|nr:DUF4351 domain-containing protein [Microcoleus sp. FACHB-68]MBD1939544.1 DUF4351 domain-containing protein [Microcoleus sp. FACHB-68]
MAKADTGSKRLISLDPNGWVQWVTQRPDIEADEIISSEFQWIGRESDVIVKVSSPETGEFLVLNELQFRYDTRMPKRMRAYAALAEEKYNLPVYPVLINIFQPETAVQIPNRYESNFLGLQARQDYRVINLWEVDVEVAFQPTLKALLPFSPLLRGGAQESVVVRAIQILRSDQQLSELESLLGFFATYVLNPVRIQQIVRFDMAILEQSPMYQQMVQKEQKRLALRILQRQLPRKFGEVPATVQTALEALNGDQLEELLEVLIEVNSLDAFISAIPAAEENEPGEALF